MAMNEPLTQNTVADIKTEFALEREKLQIERARIDLERERLAAERERWQNESEWRARASGRMVPVSTLVYVSVICVLASGIGGWFCGDLVARREARETLRETLFEARKESETFYKTLATIVEEGGTDNAVIIRRGGNNIRLLFE